MCVVHALYGRISLVHAAVRNRFLRLFVCRLVGWLVVCLCARWLVCLSACLFVFSDSTTCVLILLRLRAPFCIGGFVCVFFFLVGRLVRKQYQAGVRAKAAVYGAGQRPLDGSGGTAEGRLRVQACTLGR